jgi:4-hydroxy-tetrahydrodipicolinate synthase
MFCGTYTALVTPFKADGSLDTETFRRLVQLQVDAGIDGIVPVGTTGESPTLDYAEHAQVIEIAVEAAAGRIKVIAGTGSNSTHEAIDLTRGALRAGADATLQVTPYYNKPNQEGLYRHFMAVADLGLPVLLYNIPGRSGREIEVDTLVRMASHPQIAAVKESAGSVERVSEILNRCPRLAVLSGDDPLTLPMMVVGASGVVSVASNVIPREVAAMVRHARQGRWEEARALHARLYPLFRDLFIDTNPIPVKAAMEMLGLGEANYRLPLCPLADAKKARLRETLRAVGVLQGA